MNREDSEIGGPAYGQPKLQRPGGSVKRARERVEAGLPLREDEVTQYPRSSPEDSPRILQRSITPSMPKKPVSPSAIGQPISRPSPALHSPQWPLSSDDDNARRRNNSPTEERTYGKGPPPQRPPRPAYVPSLLSPSKLSPQQQSNYWEQNYEISPGLGSGTPTIGTATSGPSQSSSRPSTSSSTVTIPDFPVPSMPLQVSQQTRRGANLGPPPSSRRGASSYYSQISYVTPIPEEAAESIKNGHGSFASSHVMPTSWPDGPTDSFLTGEDEDDEEADEEDGRSSRGTDHDESATLVRSASLGKRHKASLTTIKSPDTTERDAMTRAANGDSPPMPNLASRAAVAEASSAAIRPGITTSRDAQSSFAQDSASTHTAFVPPPIPSDNYVNDTRESGSLTSKYSPGGTPIDPMVRQILGGLEKGGAINPGTSPPITSPATSSKSLKSVKRPQRLDMDAVKEAESRGSLTSLPELIRRATKVATNLDRGRTASRLGLFDMLGVGDPNQEKGDRSRRFLIVYHYC